MKGASDVLNNTRLHLTESSFTILDKLLPIETTIYITVRAYNRVGLWSERSSDGFKIDDSAPEIVKSPIIDPTKGVIVNGTQVNLLYSSGQYACRNIYPIFSLPWEHAWSSGKCRTLISRPSMLCIRAPLRPACFFFFFFFFFFAFGKMLSLNCFVNLSVQGRYQS